MLPKMLDAMKSASPLREIVSSSAVVSTDRKRSYDDTFEPLISENLNGTGPTKNSDSTKEVLESLDDLDSEREDGTRPQHVTERRRAQNAIFSSWYQCLPRVGWCNR